MSSSNIFNPCPNEATSSTSPVRRRFSAENLISGLKQGVDALKQGAEVASKSWAGGFTHKVDREELKAGDHIYGWFAGHTVSHHGLVVRTKEESLLDPSLMQPISPLEPIDVDAPPTAESNRLPIHGCFADDDIWVIHFHVDFANHQGALDERHIHLTTLSYFMSREKENISLCHYGAAPLEQTIKRAGTCQTEPSDAWYMTVLRAVSLLHVGHDEPAKYSAIYRNCELFCCWCKLGARSGVKNFRTDRQQSSQSKNSALLTKGAAAAAVVGGAGMIGAAAVGAAAAAVEKK